MARHPVGTDDLAVVTVGQIDYTFCSVGSRSTRLMTTGVEESCAAIVDASIDGHVRLMLRLRLPQKIPLSDDLDASDSLCLDWNWSRLLVNLSDDGAIVGIRVHPVVVRLDSTDSNWTGP